MTQEPGIYVTKAELEIKVGDATNKILSGLRDEFKNIYATKEVNDSIVERILAEGKRVDKELAPIKEAIATPTFLFKVEGFEEAVKQAYLPIIEKISNEVRETPEFLKRIEDIAEKTAKNKLEKEIIPKLDDRIDQSLYRGIAKLRTSTDLRTEGAYGELSHLIEDVVNSKVRREMRNLKILNTVYAAGLIASLGGVVYAIWNNNEQDKRINDLERKLNHSTISAPEVPGTNSNSDYNTKKDTNYNTKTTP